MSNTVPASSDAIHVTDAQERRLIYVDDYIVDEETGEIVDLAIYPQRLLDEPFIAQTPEQVDWVMQKIHSAEAELLKQQAILASLTASQGAIIKEASRKLEWLNRRFLPDLQVYATAATAGKPVKHVKTPWGKIQLTSSSETVSVSDQAAAGKAYPHAWHLPNTKPPEPKFYISEVTEEQKTSILVKLKHGENVPGFMLVPANTECKVVTGLAKAAGN